MHKFIGILFLYFSMVGNSAAAVWVKVNESSTSKLLVDRQSILQKEQLTRAWIKIEYKAPQKNIESPDKEYDLSKLLWYFDCPAQKSATSQVFQYLNAHLVYSAGIDVKNAEFIEPVPETDLDLAMRYVCAANKPPKVATGTKDTKGAETKPPAQPATPAAKTDESAKNAEAKPAAEVKPAEAAKPEEKAGNTKAGAADKAKTAKEKEGHAKSGAHDVHWTYEGKEGPENWGKLKPEFTACDTGRNQSPIDIDAPVDATLKPLRGIQKLTAKEILNNGHTIQANFREGNMLVVDDMNFKMKQVHFHAPSENTIHGKSFPLEAHFVHADSKGNLAVIGVMFKEGKANPGLEKLWAQMPKEAGEPMPLKAKVSASEMMPDSRDYYRFSGSLTTPPCSEGVRWLMLKAPITASKEQIQAFEEVMKHHNNRPVQPLNGRVVVE